jgi:hypothetical protein
LTLTAAVSTELTPEFLEERRTLLKGETRARRLRFGPVVLRRGSDWFLFQADSGDFDRVFDLWIGANDFLGLFAPPEDAIPATDLAKSIRKAKLFVRMGGDADSIEFGGDADLALGLVDAIQEAAARSGARMTSGPLRAPRHS